MAAPQTFTGVGVVYRSDGTPLPGKRRFSFTLLPYTLPPLRGFGDDVPARPASLGCYVELSGSEPLELEGESLSLHMSDGRLVRFFLFDVCDAPPFSHTTIVEAWPEAAEARGAGGRDTLRQSA